MSPAGGDGGFLHVAVRNAAFRAAGDPVVASLADPPKLAES